jgi:hypothetical protein
VTHRFVETATGVPVRHPGLRLALGTLLCASLATAEETPNAPVATRPSAPSTRASAPSTTPSAPWTSDDSRWLAWTGVVVGSGLLAVSGWQWIVFANENSEAGDVCPARARGLARCADAEAQSRYLSARDDAKNARLLAAILGGLGAASLVTGILLFPDSDPGSAGARVAVSADPFAGDAHASLSWTW